MGTAEATARKPMPSLFRFLSVIAIIGEMTINISQDKFQKK